MRHRHDAGPGWMFEMPVTPARPHVLPTGRLDFPDDDAAVHGGRIYTLVHTTASTHVISASAWRRAPAMSLHTPLVHNPELRHGQEATDRGRPVRPVLWPPSGCPPHTWRFGHTQRGCRADRRRSEDLRRGSGRSPAVRHASLPEPSGMGAFLPRAGRLSRRRQTGRLEPHGQGPEYVSFRGSGACPVPEVGARVC